MNIILTPSTVESIKIDLTTSSLTQKQISEKHGVTPMIVNRINVGALHADIEPKTPKQKIREDLKERYNNSTRSKTWPPYPVNNSPMKLTINDQNELIELINHINTKPGWPKVILLDPEDKETLAWSIEYLNARKRKLEIKLSKVRLMIDAIESEDFSDLPPSCLKELEQEINLIKIKNERRELIQPPQQQEQESSQT